MTGLTVAASVPMAFAISSPRWPGFVRTWDSSASSETAPADRLACGTSIPFESARHAVSVFLASPSACPHRVVGRGSQRLVDRTDRRVHLLQRGVATDQLLRLEALQRLDLRFERLDAHLFGTLGWRGQVAPAVTGSTRTGLTTFGFGRGISVTVAAGFLRLRPLVRHRFGELTGVERDDSMRHFRLDKDGGPCSFTPAYKEPLSAFLIEHLVLDAVETKVSKAAKYVQGLRIWLVLRNPYQRLGRPTQELIADVRARVGPVFERVLLLNEPEDLLHAGARPPDIYDLLRR